MIIFTAQGSVKNAVEAMRRGAVDFLEKPFTREQFLLVLVNGGGNADEKRRFQNLTGRRVEKQRTGNLRCRFCD